MTDILLTAKTLAELSKGDVIEAESLLAGLTDEPLTIRLVKKNKNKVYEFEVSYFGVRMNSYACKVQKNGNLSWSGELHAG